MNSSKSDIVNPYLSGRKPSSSSTPAMVPILTPQAKSSMTANEKKVPPVSAVEAVVRPMETAVAVVSEMKSKKPSTLSHNKHHNNTNMSKRQQLISELRTLKKQQQLQRKQLELYKLQKKQRKLLKKQQQKQQQTQQQQEEEEQGANTTSNEQQPIPATVTSTMNDSSSASNDNGPAPSIPTVNAQEMTKESSKAEQEQQNPSPPPDEEKESKPTVTAALANEEQMICTSHLASIMEAETATMPTITEATIDLSTVQTQETPNEEMPTSNKPATAAPSPPGHLEDKEPSNAIHGNNDNSSNTTNHSALHPSHSQSSAMSYQNSSSMNNNSMVYPYSWPLQLPQQHHNHHQQLPQMPQYPWHFHPRPFDTIGTYPSLWNYTSHPYLLNPHPVALFPGTDPSLRYLAPWQQQNHAHYAGATSKDAWNQTPSEPAPVKPPPTQMALARGTTTTSNRVDAKKKLAATRLASTPCEPPSPFAKTHDILNEILHVVKPDDANSSFGVILKLDMRSILMENSEILNPATSTNNATANADPMIPQKPRRRKRFFFSVLMVSDPSVHNKRRLEAVNTDDKSTTSHPPLLLQTDDIVLEINGTSTANLSFHEACSLFKTCTASTHIEGINQKMIVCPIRVARRRLSPPKKPLALAVPAILQNRMLPSKGPLDKQETLELALGAFWANWDPRRLLGQPPSSSLLGQITFHSLTSSVLLNNRGHSFDLEAAWNGIRNQIETQIKRAAAEYWNEKWKNMPEPHWTDAKLAALRAKPRPSSGGCRCGSKDHRYVNDPKCPLYCDLVSVAPESGEAKENEFILSERDILAQRRRVLSKSLHEAEKELNVVQKAFTERIIRIQTESEVDLVEAKFINRMEKVQLSRLQQAVAAPKSLTAMVLSAIFELEAEFDDGENQGPLLQLPQKPTVLFENKRVTPEKNLTSNIDSVDRDSDDEDDDVPLAALGKRMPDPDDSLPNDSLHSEKRRRGNPSIVLNALYLARMIQFLSHKWGHVYREPSNEEYLWRWEVYHGQADESDDVTNKWDNVQRSSSPRKPGYRSLENLRYLINDAFMSELKQKSEEIDGGKKDCHCLDSAVKVLAHVISSGRTGICDELLALLRAGAIHIDDGGVFVPAKDWWSKVDFLLLEDMDENWSNAADVDGKYGISSYMRKILSKKWCRTEYGWALTSESDDIVFDFAEFDEWRAAFEEKQSARLDGAVGVGKFR